MSFEKKGGSVSPVSLSTVTRESQTAHLRFGIQRDDVIVLMDQTARVADVDRGLLLVTGHDPDLDPGLPQGLDRFRDPLLQSARTVTPD